MDEITLFRGLRPAPPSDTEQIRTRARTRLETPLSGSPGPVKSTWRRPRALAMTAGAVAIAAAAAIMIPAVLSTSMPESLVTAAWAVQRKPDGTITVYIRQMRDPAGLQRALRADGVPAYIRYVPEVVKPHGSVTEYPACDYNFGVPNKFNFNSIFSFLPPKEMAQGKVAFLIHPAGIPKGYSVFVEINWVPESVLHELEHELGYRQGASYAMYGSGFGLVRDGQVGPCVPNGPKQ